MKYWKKRSKQEQDNIITAALAENVDYSRETVLGIPASKLDSRVFSADASFLKDAPLLRTYVANPNHIGCHTMGDSEPFFAGTQQLEREVIELLSVDILKAAENSCDGYVATGGTEANIQAAWMYRNYFMQEHKVSCNQIALLSSADTHYSVVKAANLLGLQSISVPVHQATRVIEAAALEIAVEQALREGVKCFIVIANMATTMFGSVDDPDVYIACLQRHQAPFRMHVDGAFGGFIYPVTAADNKLDFRNPHISSITLDAHKMLQAPYGTGIFITRKGLMESVYTREAAYVNGMDITLCGSRGGVNAVAVWMILSTYGPHGWREKLQVLLSRTDWLCARLAEAGISFYRHPDMNIVTMRAASMPRQVAAEFGLVPDSHTAHPEWYKVVVMDHVEIEHLASLINAINMAKNELLVNSDLGVLAG